MDARVAPNLQKGLVFVAGNFNILHPGHIRLLHQARGLGSQLIVGIFADHIAGDRIISQELRLEAMRSLSWIDEVILIDESLNTTISVLKPEFVLKGKEHELASNTEMEALDAYGGKLLFSSGEVIFSSLELIREEFRRHPEVIESMTLPTDFCIRHNITFDSIQSTLEKFATMKVLVVGDLIVDEYISCQPLGMSQEDPSIAVTPLDSQLFVGGAGIVASHASALGASVNLFSLLGDDETANFARRRLRESNVQLECVTDSTRPTTLKQRFRAKGTTLLRVSHLRQQAISLSLQNVIYESIIEASTDADLVIFSDFNYGALPQPLVSRLIPQLRQKGITLAADSQSSSQTGDIARFFGMDLLTPTEREARISVKNHEDGLIKLSDSLKDQSNARHIILTLGEEGILIHSHSEDATNTSKTDRIRALNPTPKDTAGAGDSMLTTAAMCLSAGASIWESALLGSLMAAIQTGRVGNQPIDKDSIRMALTRSWPQV